MNAAWMAEAACRDTIDPEAWFRSDKHAADRADTATAVAICQTCPVRELCLERALVDEGGVNGVNRFGIFGGLTPSQRARTRPRAKLLARCGTPGAARRHRRRGEVMDPACERALQAYDRGRSRDRREVAA